MGLYRHLIGLHMELGYLCACISGPPALFVSMYITYLHTTYYIFVQLYNVYILYLFVRVYSYLADDINLLFAQFCKKSGYNIKKLNVLRKIFTNQSHL